MFGKPLVRDTRKIGQKGEHFCRQFLQQFGWKILKQNLRTPWGEVDIICERQGCLRAVEVKTRSGINGDWIPGIVSRGQRRRVQNGLVWYAKDCGKYPCREMSVYLAIVDLLKRKISFYQLPAEE